MLFKYFRYKRIAETEKGRENLSTKTNELVVLVQTVISLLLGEDMSAIIIIIINFELILKGYMLPKAISTPPPKKKKICALSLLL